MSNVLLITNKEDITTDFIVKELNNRGVNYFRFNTEEIGKTIDVSIKPELSSFNLHHNNETIDLNDIHSIYYRRPKLPTPDDNLSNGEKIFFYREMETLLDGIYRFLEKKKWFNNVFDIRKTENKIFQLLVAKKIGFELPSSLVTNIPKHANSFVNNTQSIFKPLKNGFVEENEKTSKILYTNNIDENFINEINRIKEMPVYFQNKINKKSDIRITVINKKIHAIEIDSQISDISATDWRRAKNILPHKKITINSDLRKKILKLCSFFNLNFAAIDLALDDHGNYVFFEINANGQWAWIEKLLNIEMSKQIVDFLE